MKKLFLLSGLVAFAGSGAVACGGMEGDTASVASGVRPGETLVITADDANGDSGGFLSCGDPEACFEVDSSFHNITHLFLDFNEECVEDFGDITMTVTDLDDSSDVRIYTSEDFHTSGGPCGDISRVIWTPLQANQQNVEVCVFFEGDFIPERVRLGAKASNLCEETGGVTEDCLDCGAGGTGGTGGTGGVGGFAGGEGGTGGTGGKPKKDDCEDDVPLQ
ncbi:hypothetical protein [Vulgatibacter sp.]|uniref:hypothetical protein n=1 Tax=Vulgatibacter sp. TaxID=1971226 RepID=UPI00356376D9